MKKAVDIIEYIFLGAGCLYISMGIVYKVFNTLKNRSEEYTGKERFKKIISDIIKFIVFVCIPLFMVFSIFAVFEKSYANGIYKKFGGVAILVLFFISGNKINDFYIELFK